METDIAFSDLHGSAKLDGQNYAMWHRKIQYFLHPKKILEHLTTSMPEPVEPENEQTAQYRRELDAYNKWRDQDLSARFTMLSCMHDNLIREYEKYSTAKELWEVLKNAGTELSDEQQVLAVLRSLPEQTCGHLKMVLTHNEQIKTFESVTNHLKLEADRRETERAHQAALVAHAGQRKPIKANVGINRLVQDRASPKAKARTWPHKVTRL
ncbi:hypothetical protein Salat_1452700 [Sesamum alatum]|uniref:Uncharacterized protein n=1 Tax=Sesamum alatum TaxID=300844 RepID=A0AAE1YB36_9LAMI|nr:hypothetical protein Salat_1452700 [Sesamum alatum]